MATSDAVREARDLLLFVVFVDLEVFLRQVVNVVAFFVGHDGIDQDEFRFSLDDWAVAGPDAGRRVPAQCPDWSRLRQASDLVRESLRTKFHAGEEKHHRRR